MTRFSSFAQTLQASDIAELLALTEKPEVISFAGGLPAPELFPIEEMKKVDEAIYNEEAVKPCSMARRKVTCLCAKKSASA